MRAAAVSLDMIVVPQTGSGACKLQVTIQYAHGKRPFKELVPSFEHAHATQSSHARHVGCVKRVGRCLD